MAHHIPASPGPRVAGNETIAHVRGVRVLRGTGHAARPLVDDVNFDLRRGERLGVAGGEASGTSALARAISGRAAHGETVIGGTVQLGGAARPRHGTVDGVGPRVHLVAVTAGGGPDRRGPPRAGCDLPGTGGGGRGGRRRSDQRSAAGKRGGAQCRLPHPCLRGARRCARARDGGPPGPRADLRHGAGPARGPHRRARTRRGSAVAPPSPVCRDAGHRERATGEPRPATALRSPVGAHSRPVAPRGARSSGDAPSGVAGTTARRRCRRAAASPARSAR